jgi:hypothetical protein
MLTTYSIARISSRKALSCCDLPANRSLACVFLQLLAYRRREHDPGPQLAGLPAPLRRLILHMIQLEPGDELRGSHCQVP